MGILNEVIENTLNNLKQKGIDATPNEYHKEFCKVAKELNYKVPECERFQEFLEKLDIEEKKRIKALNITTMDDLLPIILDRVSKSNLKTLVGLFTESLVPSLKVSIDKDLAQFSMKIDSSPDLVFENEIQEEMKKFINKRFAADKSVVEKNTEEIARLISLMNQYLSDAINSNEKGNSHINELKEEISSFDMEGEGIDGLNLLQNKLISVTTSIENELNKIGGDFTLGKDKVNKLQEKIEKLEKELGAAKKESSIDSLTGLLTRRSYEIKADIAEREFERLNSHYAIVFFDLDNFKKVNDTYGHNAGDVVLSTFAKILKSQTREIDVLGRFGGEEFIALIKYVKIDEVVKYVKRVKSIINDNEIKCENTSISVTFSAGVAKRKSCESYNLTVKEADNLLYKAKNNGKNQIQFDDGTIV